MRDIQFRYTWKKKEDDFLYQTITSMNCLEGKGDKPFLGNELWEFLGRDQDTGLHDKYKKKIFENDFIVHPQHTRPSSSSRKSALLLYRVVWYSGDNESNWEMNADRLEEDASLFQTQPRFIGEGVDKQMDYAYRYGDWSVFSQCQIVGNVYENPDLLNFKGPWEIIK